jgi:hypothetical protein
MGAFFLSVEQVHAFVEKKRAETFDLIKAK